MRKVIPTSERLISENEEEKSMFLQEGFLVNHFLLQVKEREQRTTVISGLRCSESYKRSGPIGSLLRTLLASSRWYSPVRRLKWEVNPLYSERVSLYLKDSSNMLLKPFALILNVKDIPSSRYLYRLAPSVRLTAGIGFGLLPTVTAQDFKQRGPNSRQQGLPEMIREGLLPTPVASDAGVGTVIGKNDRIVMTPKGKIRKVNQKGHYWSIGLSRMVGLLPTPRANLINGCNLGSPELANRNKGNLEEVISQWIQEEMIPTPTARDWKGAASPESLEKRGRIPEKNSLPDFFARTGKSFQLNPLFVAEMMGFPPDWTVSPFLNEEKNPLKDTETPSSPR